MNTALDCIPCFFQQILSAAETLHADEQTTKRIIDRVCSEIPQFTLTDNPPRMGMIIHQIIQEELDNPDPYKELKDFSNRQALSIRPACADMIRASEDPLLTAVELSIAGNIIDYGAHSELNPEEEIRKILKRENKLVKTEDPSQFAYDDFRKDLSHARSLLYLGDNTGEIVFDGLLIEEIRRQYPELQITLALRDRPILNDATREDALLCGIDRHARILSSGSDAPGTLLDRCNDPFLTLFEESDLIISKGQGNFEALSETPGPLYFFFMAKCKVIVSMNNCRLHDILLKKGRRFSR